MTDSSYSTAPTYILELSFDAVQVTETLQYRIFTEAGERCDELGHGPLAGTFNFQKNDQINIQIVGSAESKPGRGGVPEFDYEIVDCTLVSIKPPGDQDLSFFDPANACTAISGWKTAKPVVDPENSRITKKNTTKKPLQVTAEKGQWKISGYLSVIVNLNGQSMNKLYYFDPEGSVGDGGWGPP